MDRSGLPPSGSPPVRFPFSLVFLVGFTYFWLHSLMDRMKVSGTFGVGSIPSGATKKNPYSLDLQEGTDF